MKLKFKYNESDISFNLIYRKRKTMCIKINQDGEIDVISPMGIDKEAILKNVKTKAEWIIKKKEELNEIPKVKLQKDIIDGEKFMYLGKECELIIIVDKVLENIYVDIENKNIVVKTPIYEKEIIKSSIENWYKQNAYNLLLTRINKYSSYFKDEIKSIKVKNQKTRWASLTAKNEMNFNYRCIMAPIEVFDYVVVHEMCHMEYRNHSKDFYNRVESILPNYKSCHKWMYENGSKLNI